MSAAVDRVFVAVVAVDARVVVAAEFVVGGVEKGCAAYNQDEPAWEEADLRSRCHYRHPLRYSLVFLRCFEQRVVQGIAIRTKAFLQGKITTSG